MTPPDAAAVPAPIETLLAEREWVRRLARTLVADDAAADDLEQEAWLAAVERPPRHGGSIRGWLSTVLRRAAGRGRRDAYRRDRREAASARSEAEMTCAPTADVVAHAELHRRVVSAVLALAEPFRTAVLLRFFDGLPPREIAARTATTAETARSRVRRGIEALRERFDREHNGDRRAWVAALIALAGPQAPTATSPTPAATARPVVDSVAPSLRWLPWAVVGGVAAVITLLVFAPPWQSTSTEPGTTAGDLPSAPPALASDSSSTGALAARPAVAPEAATFGRRPARVTGIVRTSSGVPVVGASVVAFGSEPVWQTDFLPMFGQSRSDSAGRYAVVDLRAKDVTLVARANGLVIRGLAGVRTDGSNPLAVELVEGETVERDLVMDPLESVDGRVLDVEGRPAAAEVRADLIVKDGTPETGADVWMEACETQTRDDGTFSLAGVPRGTQVRFEASCRGCGRGTAGPMWSPDDVMQPLELRLAASRSIDVLVVDAETDAPAGGVLVAARLTERSSAWPCLGGANTKADGRVRFADMADAEVAFVACWKGDDGQYRSGSATAGADETEVTIRGEPSRPPAVGLHLHELRARIVGPDGKPVPAGEKASYRWEHGGGGGGIGAFRHGVAHMGWSSPPEKYAEAWGATDEDGRPLPFGAAFVAVEGRSEVELRMGPERAISGTVKDESGTPVAGILVRARPARWAGIPLLLERGHSQVRTDANGDFRLRQLADEAYDVVVVAPTNQVAPMPPRVDAGAKDVVLTLRSAETVIVRVLCGGEPVKGVNVSVWRPDVPAKSRGPGRTPPIASGTTDGQGRVRLQRLDLDGPYVLQFEPPRDPPDLVRRVVTSWVPREARQFDLSPDAHLVVVDADGHRVPGARILWQDNGESTDLLRAGEDGTAVVRDMGHSADRLVAVSPNEDVADLRGSRASQVVHPGDDVTLVVHPGAPIDVEIIGGLDGADVHLDLFTRDTRDARQGWVSGDGGTTSTRRVRLLSPFIDRAHGLLVRTRDHSFATFVDGVRAGPEPTRVVLAPALRITGRVTAPPAAQKVRVTVRQDDGPHFEYVWPDDRGDYLATGLPAGRYRVEARPDEGNRSLHAEGVVEAGGTLDLTLHD